jgi:FkbM family methyltransferase
MGVSAAFRKFAVLWRLSRRKQIRLGDSEYRLRSFFVNELALRNGAEAAEPALNAVYAATLKCKPGAFLDVGANIGQTLFKILSIERGREYVGFEPQASCCFLVQRFMEENGLKDHTILSLGLSNRNQVVKLYFRGQAYDSSASTIENFRPESFYSGYRYVWVRKGDEVVSELQLPKISTIKIDVEGGELEVLLGLSDTIREQQPFIIFEVLNFYLVLSGEKLDEAVIAFRRERIDGIERTLRGAGYDIYQVLPEPALKKVETIQPGTTADLSATNYVAIPKDQVSTFFASFQGSVQDASLQPA